MSKAKRSGKKHDGPVKPSAPAATTPCSLGLIWVAAYPNSGWADDLPYCPTAAAKIEQATPNSPVRFRRGDVLPSTHLTLPQGTEPASVLDLYPTNVTPSGHASPGRDSVNNATLAYFIGHGTSDCPTFPKADSDANGSFQSDLPRWGVGELRWVVLDCCEGLSFDVFDHWRSVFHGIHGILGHQTVAAQSVDRGERFARYMNEDGTSLRTAWRHACQETEPPPMTTYMGSPDYRVSATLMVAGPDGVPNQYWLDGPPNQAADGIDAELVWTTLTC